MTVMKFESAKDFVTAMMDNEGKLFFDHYGRQWRYSNYKFTFKDIGADSVHKTEVACLHLFGTFIEMEK